MSLRVWQVFLSAAVAIMLSTAVCPAQKACPWSRDYFRVEDTNGKFGYIDRKGNIVLSPEQLPERTVLAFDFREGLAPVAVNERGNIGYSPGSSKFGFIDITGKFVIAPQFGYTYGFCNGLAWVDRGSFQGYVDRSGAVVIDLKKDCDRPDLKEPFLSRCPRRTEGNRFVGEESEGLTAVSNGLSPISKYGFVDSNGRMVIEPRFEPELQPHFSIRYLTKFVEGRAKVKLSGLYGFIDKRGKQVVPAKFTTASDFSEGLAFVVTTNGESGYIDKKGRWALKARGWENGGDFKEGLAAVSVKSDSRSNPLWGYIDRRGKFMIKPRFDSAVEFISGIARVYEIAAADDGKWDSRFGFIDKTGKYIWKPNSTFVPRVAPTAHVAPTHR